MKNTLKRLLCLLLALIMCTGLALGAAAVENGEPGSDPGDGGNNEDKEVYASRFDPFSPSTVKIYLGNEPTLLEPNVQPADYNMGIEWASNNTQAASVDSDGRVTAVSVGSAQITATVTASGGGKLSQTCTVTVAENSVESITIKSEDDSNTIEGKGSLQLHAYARYTDGSDDLLDDVDWSSSSTAIATVTSDGLVESTGAGRATITARAQNGKTATFAITVTGHTLTVSGNGIKGEGSRYTLSMSNGSTVKLSAEVSPKNTFTELGDITWESNKPAVVSVDNSGTLKALSNGTAVITAKCDTLTSTVTVTVGNATANIDDTTTRNSDIYFSDIYSELVKKFTDAYGKPADSATFRFTALGSSTYGTLYTKRSANTTVAANKDYNLSDVSIMYFVPNSVGRYEMSYSLTYDGHTMTGKITVTVSGSKSKDIIIRLKDDSAYAFNSSSTLGNVSGASAINTAIKEASGVNYSCIVFKSPGSTSSRVGTLYPNSSKNYDLGYYNSYTAGSTSNSRQSPVSSLYFDPKKEGTYKVEYTAYDSKDVELCSGYLIIEVGATDSATVTVTLDSDSAYGFTQKTKKDGVSAATAIDSAIKDETKTTYSYIIFNGSVSSGSSVGTLYANSDKSSLGSGRKYSRSTSATYSVSDLYFVPERDGTYVRGFIAYDSNNKELLEGTLKIVVPGDSDMDIYFNTTTGGSVSLSEDVFESWFRQQKGSSYKLAYVTFDDESRSFGAFKHSSTSFVPGNEVRYYTDSYTGSVGSSAKYLDNVKYTAPNSTGSISVDFTCYGGTSASSSSTKVSGSFSIFVTKSSVKGITYDAKSDSVVILRESDFSTVHKNAMSLSSASSTKFYIELLEIPSKGTLYYNYANSGRYGTKLTSSNFDNYKFYINAGSSYDSVADLTYVPDVTTTGNASVRYLARSTSGEAMYVGSITFSRGKDQTASIKCGADGYTFKAADFYSSSDKDPVAYVVFDQPSDGELMINYTNGRGVPLDSSVRLYTVSYTSGAYALSSLSYIPRAGFSGNATVDYTAVTESGKAQSGTLTIAVSGKKGSSHFKDVGSTGSGAWASDSIDFAYKWGLVNGTGADTFSPDATMTRAMLVTILYRAAGTPKVSGSCPFKDVPAGMYYYDAVIWAAENGIVNGTSPTTFSPDRAVNREQVAAFLHRYAKYNGENVSVTNTLSGYVDKSSVSSYAIEPISWAVQRGYITSASSSEMLLSPGGNATRAQVAVMIHRFLTY